MKDIDVVQLVSIAQNAIKDSFNIGTPDSPLDITDSDFKHPAPFFKMQTKSGSNFMLLVCKLPK